MSIVLPRRKNTDFLAPSKTLLDAKKKLGPIYFDAKLIECPQNAVELTKLIQRLDDLEKQKFKAIEETSRSERILLHNFQSKQKFTNSGSSVEIIPDIRDVKLPPPGFRYHANGDPKMNLNFADPKYRVKEEFKWRPPGMPRSDTEQLVKSTFITSNEIPVDDEFREDVVSEARLFDAQEDLSAPDDDETNNEDTIPKYVNGESKITISANNTDQKTKFAVNYAKEIADLEKIIKEINEDLANNSIDLNEYSGAKGKVYSFLRAHARGDRVSWKHIVEPPEFKRPNDRFVIPPGSSTFNKSDANLHKREVKTRTHGNCQACQLKLKHNDLDYQQMKRDIKRKSFVLPKWNIAPKGKLVPQPSSHVSFQSSQLQARIKSSLMVNSKLDSRLSCPSNVREHKSSKTISLKNNSRAKSAMFHTSSVNHQDERQNQDVRRLQSAMSYRNSSSSDQGNSPLKFWKNVAVS